MKIDGAIMEIVRNKVTYMDMDMDLSLKQRRMYNRRSK